MQTSEPRTLLTHPELRSHQSLPVFKTLGEPPKSRLERLLSIFADVRSGEGVGHAAARSQHLPAAGGLLADEAGARWTHLDGGRGRARIVFGCRAGSSADGCRAALRVARHARRAHPAHLHHDDVLFRHARGLLFRRASRTAGRGRLLHLDRPHQRLHRLAVLGLRQRHLHRRPGAQALSPRSASASPLARGSAPRPSRHSCRGSTTRPTP